MIIPIQPIVFYFFSGLLLLTGAMVVISRNPVRGALFLVVSFFASAVLWMLMEAEFLSLVLIFVYVGAVMTLFLFVVMMINVKAIPQREAFVRYLPAGVFVMALLLGLMLFVTGPQHFGAAKFAHPTLQGAQYSNVKELGSVLYTDYFYAFEVAGALLLVGIIAAISLAFRGRQNSRTQRIASQLEADKASRLRIVKMNSETKR